MKASFGFFEILLIIIASFYLLGWLSRLLLPFIAKAYMKRMSARFGFPMPNQEEAKPGKPGKITVKNQNQSDAARSGNLDKVGEFTDYEEIKE